MSANRNSSFGGCPFSSGGSAGKVRPKRSSSPVYYHDYLQLDKILTAQKPLSRIDASEGFSVSSSISGTSNRRAAAPLEEQESEGAHEEMLFIIIHQTYELWFKLIIHEVDSCIKYFQQTTLPEKDLLRIVSRLRRVTQIQKVLVDQLAVLETMTPLDFLDFRDYLYPASGFESVQFRLMENKLGLQSEVRIKHANRNYKEVFQTEHAELVGESEVGASLFELLEKWLERTPVINNSEYDFLKEYEAAVYSMYEEDKLAIQKNSDLSGEERELKISEEVDNGLTHFESIFSEEKHNELILKGRRKLSHKATLAALLIMIYRDEPLFQMPFQLLTTLMDIDEFLTTWRYGHANMVARMLGSKIGTGGSSGYHYLRTTGAEHRIFTDLFNLSSFMIPRSAIPELPEDVLRTLQFNV